MRKQIKLTALAVTLALITTTSAISQVQQQQQPPTDLNQLPYYFRLSEIAYREIRMALQESDRSKRVMDMLIAELDRQFSIQVQTYQKQIDSMSQPRKSPLPQPKK